MSKQILIIGGHGNVALRLSQLLTAQNHTVTSLIRNPDHAQDIQKTGASPLLFSLEDASVEDFTKVFEEKSVDVVYFTAGAGAKSEGGARTKKVDLEGAIKVFDAIEGVKGRKPRLILVSCIDSRDRSKPPPDYYNESDLKESDRMWTNIKTYMECKYLADLDLAKRTSFKWTMLRPGHLLDTPGTGTASMGKVHLARGIARDDVAVVLAALVDREDAAGLGIDLVAKKALKSMEGFVLDGHVLHIKFAGRGTEEDGQNAKAAGSGIGGAMTTKMIVKNVPFEATEKDIRELFGCILPSSP